jgi:hypothetical protein
MISTHNHVDMAASLVGAGAGQADTTAAHPGKQLPRVQATSRAGSTAALCYGSHGGGARLAFHTQPVAYATDSLIAVLGELRGFLDGEKATLI